MPHLDLNPTQRKKMDTFEDTCEICLEPLTEEASFEWACASCEAEAEELDQAFFGDWGD